MAVKNNLKKPVAENKAGFPIPEGNYKMILIGFAIVVLGFILMMGGGSEDPNQFNYDIFSFRRITLAPIVVLAGFGFVFWAIMRKPKKEIKYSIGMDWIEALVLGVIQGLTEFLPVSSSGHLQIFSALFGIQGEENLAFAVVVHAATVCSTIVVLWKEIAALFGGLFKFRWNEETLYVAKIAVSMIPVAIVGLFFKDAVEELFGSGLLVVGVALLVTAVLLAFAYYAKPRQKTVISFRDALVIGVAQACAVIPGLSRSGSTIATGILLGNNKERVAKFSFLMVLVPILGEALLELMKGDFAQAESGISALSLVVGFCAAFVSGYFACSWMINLVKKGKLIWFALYCLVVGVVVLILH